MSRAAAQVYLYSLKADLLEERDGDDTPTKPWRLEGAALAGLRKARDWKARELARRAGVSADLLSRYETGIKAPSAEQLDRLLEPLACSRREFRGLAAELARLVGTGVEGERAAFLELAPEDRRQIRGVGWVLQRLGEEELERWALGREARRARRRASVRVRQLLGFPRREWPVLVAHMEEYGGWAVMERLCLMSEKAASDSADRALELAELALRVAETVEPEGPLRARARGFAWAYVGNARRVRNDLDGAREAFARSSKSLGRRRGGGSLPLGGVEASGSRGLAAYRHPGVRSGSGVPGYRHDGGSPVRRRFDFAEKGWRLRAVL